MIANIFIFLLSNLLLRFDSEVPQKSVIITLTLITAANNFFFLFERTHLSLSSFSSETKILLNHDMVLLIELSFYFILPYNVY